MIDTIVNECLEKSNDGNASNMGLALGVSRQVVHFWKHGKAMPELGYLLAVIVAYDDWRREFALRCIDEHREYYLPLAKVRA